MLMHKVGPSLLGHVLQSIMDHRKDGQQIEYYGNQSAELAATWTACGGEIRRGEEKGTGGHAVSWWAGGNPQLRGIEAWATFM